MLIILKPNFDEWKIVYCFTYFWSAVHCIDVPREEFHSEFYCHEAKQRQHGGGTVEIFALDTSSCRYGPHPHSVSIIFRCTKGARPSSSPSALIRPCTIRDACFAMILMPSRYVLAEDFLSLYSIVFQIIFEGFHQ